MATLPVTIEISNQKKIAQSFNDPGRKISKLEKLKYKRNILKGQLAYIEKAIEVFEINPELQEIIDILDELSI